MKARVELLGVKIAAVDLDGAVARVGELVSSPGLTHVVTANTDFLAQATRDPSLASIIERADLVVADGVPLLWMARWQGTPLPGRVNGTDLVVRLLAEAGRHGWGVYLLGGEPGVAEAAAASAQRRFGVRIVGASGPSRADMDDPISGAAVADGVAASGSRLLLLAIGGGRQERWIDLHRSRLGGGVAIGVGSALEFLAGTRRRAPVWMQRVGLEWAFRLVLEPRRLARRYLVDDLRLLAAFALGDLRRRRG